MSPGKLVLFWRLDSIAGAGSGQAGEPQAKNPRAGTLRARPNGAELQVLRESRRQPSTGLCGATVADHDGTAQRAPRIHFAHLYKPTLRSASAGVSTAFDPPRLPTDAASVTSPSRLGPLCIPATIARTSSVGRMGAKPGTP